MTLIDKDELVERLTRKKSGPANQRFTEGFNDATMRFRSMLHAASVVDPVHAAGACYCRECLYYCQNNKGLAHPECRFGPWKRPDPNDFCNCGVMR